MGENTFMVYIASPYTKGNTANNIRRQIEIAEKLNEFGMTPFVPLLSHLWHLMSPHEHEYWMQLDFQYIQKCDAFVRLSGESSGADREVNYALGIGIPVYFIERTHILQDVNEYYIQWKKEKL